jgi:hypothetical protein
MAAVPSSRVDHHHQWRNTDPWMNALINEYSQRIHGFRLNFSLQEQKMELLILLAGMYPVYVNI